MSTGLEQIRERMAEYLREMGIFAAAAWPGESRMRQGKPFVLVSLRECQVEPAGFRNYLGEFYDRETGLWEERYGRSAQLTFGLDLYALAEDDGEILQKTFLEVAEALTKGEPQGLFVETVSCGETVYDRESGRLKRSVQAVCKAYLYTIDREGQIFVEFELRGGMKT